MKNPKLKFQEVYIVETWDTNMRKGVGIYFPKLQDYLVEYSDLWLVWFDGNNITHKFSGNKVFTDYTKALNALERTKEDYLKYVQKEFDKYSGILGEFK